MFNLFKKKEKVPIMEFFCHPDFHGLIPEPKPAGKYIAEWYKKVPIHIDGKKDSFGQPAMTAKKCMPLIDAMTLGYVLPLVGDLTIETNIDRSVIKATNPPGIKLCEFHSLDQVGGEDGLGHPAPPPKFINYWVIKTAPGYSTLFMPLLNQFEDRFTCFSALVDTDVYTKEVNLPCIWNISNFTGTLSAGTPLVVVIPIKREDVPKNPIIRAMTGDEFNNIESIRKRMSYRNHVYTNELRVERK